MNKYIKPIILSCLLLAGCSTRNADSGEIVTGGGSTNVSSSVRKALSAMKTDIEVEQDEKLDLLDYFKLTSVETSTETEVDTSKVGKQTVGVTITLKNGNVIYQDFTVNVKEKEVIATPTPEPTQEATPEPTQEASNQQSSSNNSSSNTYRNNSSSSNNSSSNSGGNTYVAPVTPSEPEAEVETPADTSGAASGTTYDSYAACESAASTTRSHACTFDPAIGKVVLTY